MPKRSLPGQAEFNRLNRAVDELLQQGGRAANTRAGKSDPSLAPVLRVASALRNLPRDEFKETLSNNLERSASMAATAEPIAAVAAVAIPRLTFKRAAPAIDFYVTAFGAEEVFRFEVGDSIAHAEIKIGDSVVTLSEEWPEGGRFSAETLGQSPVQVTLRVNDVDSFAARAVAAGLKVVNPVRDQFYGRREGTFADPFGYMWNIMTVTRIMRLKRCTAAFTR